VSNRITALPHDALGAQTRRREAVDVCESDLLFFTRAPWCSSPKTKKRSRCVESDLLLLRCRGAQARETVEVSESDLLFCCDALGAQCKTKGRWGVNRICSSSTTIPLVLKPGDEEAVGVPIGSAQHNCTRCPWCSTRDEETSVVVANPDLLMYDARATKQKTKRAFRVSRSDLLLLLRYPW
jgi:hypothetical protein